VQAAACNPALLLPVARVLLRSLQLGATLPGGAHGSVRLVTDVNALVDLIEVHPSTHPLPRAALCPPPQFNITDDVCFATRGGIGLSSYVCRRRRRWDSPHDDCGQPYID
jgi:hypothetical protein